MANKAPIFPLPEPPQQFSDYGFDPQFDYLQLMEEARQHKHDVAARSIDAPKFKLQKPISKAETSKNRNNNNNNNYYYNRHSSPAKKSWWKKALLLFRFKRRTVADRATAGHDINAAAYRGMRGSVSEPVYITESRSGSSTPYRTRSRPSSGPLAGMAAPARRGEVEVPYLSLTELGMGDEPRSIPASPTPLYLVN